MPRKIASFRLDEGLIAEVVSYAEARRASQGQVVEAALREFLDTAKGGVPELPVPDTPAVRQQRAKAAPKWKPEPEGEPTYAQLLGSRQARLNADKERATRGRR